MIADVKLTPEQVRIVATIGRLLPDEELAPLVLSSVLDRALSVLTSASAPVSPDLAPQPTAAPHVPGARSAAVRGPYTASQRRIDDVVKFLATHPDSSMSDIARELGCARNVAREAVVRAIQDERVERRGTGNDTTYRSVGVPADSHVITSQVVDGEHQQRLVHVERRRGIAQDPGRGGQPRR